MKSLHRASFPTAGVGQRKSAAWVKSVSAPTGALIRRLEGIYDEILIDEVQDLSAYDWDILDALLISSIEIWMVGDIRQAVLATNGRSC